MSTDNTKEPLMNDKECIAAFCAADESPWRVIRDIYERARQQDKDRIKELTVRLNDAERLLRQTSKWMHVKRRRMPIAEIDAFLTPSTQ